MKVRNPGPKSTPVHESSAMQMDERGRTEPPHKVRHKSGHEQFVDAQRTCVGSIEVLLARETTPHFPAHFISA